MTKQKLAFLAIFTLLGFGALQVPFTELLGSNVRFTLFDFVAPLAGSFVGTGVGVAAVLVMQIVNTLLHGGFDTVGALIRLFPTLFAVWYFASPRKQTLFVPLLAMVAFNLHPIGKTVWYYSLFWTVPVFAHVVRKRFLLARAFGATFTAHSVGGAAWIWAFHLPATTWNALIPQVIVERTMMAVGIVVMYRLFVSVLYWLKSNGRLRLPFTLEYRHVFSFLK